MMGNMMGFRPLGYADGDLVMDEQDRVVLIEYLMDMTGMGAGTFVGLSNAQLENARRKVEADALAAQTQQMQQMAPVQGPAGLMAPMQQMAPMMEEPMQRSPESGFLGAPEDVGNLGRMGSAFGDSSISNYDMSSMRQHWYGRRRHHVLGA